MISFLCKCGKKFSVEDKYAGKKGKCPKCKEVVRIPQQDNEDIFDDIINDSVNENSHKPRKNPTIGNTVQGNFISIDEKRIHFTCQQCEEVMTAPKALFGKTILCGICGSNVIVPDNKPQLELKAKPVANSFDQTYTSTNEHQQSEVSSGMPAWIWCLYGVTAVIIISALLYVFVFRDTWEIDHYSELSEMISEIQNYISEDDFDGATKIYNQLSVLIGDRQIKKESLRDDFTNVQTEYGILEKEKQAQAELAMLEKQRKLEEKRRVEERQRQALVKSRKRLAEKEKQRIAKDKAMKLAAIKRDEQKKQERIRLNNERINNGYLTERETADSDILSLLNNGTLVKARFVWMNPLTTASDRGRALYSTYNRVEAYYDVEYWTKGGMYRKGGCYFMMARVDLPDQVIEKYGIESTWKILWATVDGVHIKGFSSVERF